MVKQGWSWPAFFFNVLWAAWHRMWLLAFGAWLGDVLALALFDSLDRADVFSLVLVVGLAFGLGVPVAFGARGNIWRCAHFRSRGCAERGVVVAASAAAAESVFLRREGDPTAARGGRWILVLEFFGMAYGAVATFRPKSQVLQVGACLACLVAAGAGGLPLTLLAGLVALLYLSGGKHVDVDCDAGRVRTRWRVAGLQLSAADTRLRIRRVELRPEWMSRSSGEGYTTERKGSMVYDLVLVGDPLAGGDEEEIVVDLKEDQLFFGASERRARETARVLRLPLAVRWDRLFSDLSPAERQCGEWMDPIAYPSEMGDWRRWL